MALVLLATDSDGVFEDVDAALGGDDVTVLRVASGAHVVPACAEKNPDLVLLDMQMAAMGGVAAALAVRQEEGMNRLRRRPVALLLDRSADVFLAEQARVDGWIIKPLDPLRLRKMVTALLAGDQSFESPGVVTVTPDSVASA